MRKKHKSGLVESPSVVEGVLVTVRRHTCIMIPVHKKRRNRAMRFGKNATPPVVGNASASEGVNAKVSQLLGLGGITNRMLVSHLRKKLRLSVNPESSTIDRGSDSGDNLMNSDIIADARDTR